MTTNTPPALGTYKAQLDNSTVTFTIINTGDAPMVVDLVKKYMLQNLALVYFVKRLCRLTRILLLS